MFRNDKTNRIGDGVEVYRIENINLTGYMRLVRTQIKKNLFILNNLHIPPNSSQHVMLTLS